MAAAVSAHRSCTNGFSAERPPARETRSRLKSMSAASMACKAPIPGEAKAAIDRRRLACRHRGRADQRGRVVAPHLLGGAVIHDAQKPADHAEHAIGPAARHVAFAKRYLNVVESTEIHLVAAP